MSVQHVAWALYGRHRGDLDPSSRLVLVVLADHAGTDGVAWPGRDTIARAVGVSVDTVDRRLAGLARLGLITRAAADEVPHAWQSIRPDRRPRAYRLNFTGPQPAASPRATGPHASGAAEPNGAATRRATGPQNTPHGAAAVRHEPKEPYEPNGAALPTEAYRAQRLALIGAGT